MQEDRSLVIVALASSFVAFRRGDGTIAWRHTFEKKAFIGTTKDDGTVELAIHRGRVYAAFGDELVCLDYLTGVVIGTAKIEAGWRRPTMLFDAEQIFVVGVSKVQCLDLGGRLLWEAKHELEALRHSPAIAVPGTVVRGDVLDVYS